MASVDPAQGSVVGEDTTEVALKSVISQGNVVILREAELDTDLATAIQQVRDKADTRNSRILIIAPEQSVASHEAPKGAALPVPDMPTSVLQVARAGGEQALAGFADTYRPLLQSVERFFQEAGWVLDEIEEAGEEGIRARLKSRVRVARDIMSWIGCVLDDMNDELCGAAAGLVPVDLQILMQEAQLQVESFFPGVRISVCAAHQDMTCTGRATALAQACFLILVLTAHRIGGEGAITVEPGSEDGCLTYRILGLGEPAPVDAPEAMARLRQLIVEQHGGSIQPDVMGRSGTGLLLSLPR